jgi:Transcriptional regulator
MPDIPNPRANRKPAQTLRGPAQTAEGRQPRGARRKRETRARLLDAALRLMAERGMDSVAINDITEAADVGFGSFYNHFGSKEGIFTALSNGCSRNSPIRSTSSPANCPTRPK